MLWLIPTALVVGCVSLAFLVIACWVNPHVAPALDDDTEPLPSLTDEQFDIRWQVIAPQWASDTEGGYR